MEIVLSHLTKYYGKKEALHDISLTIPTGIFGILGRNGAGKTSLMRILATLQTPTSGTGTIYGIPFSKPKRIREIIGYLPQDFSIYPNMTVYGAMDYFGILSEIPAPERKKRILDLLEQVHLQDNLKTRIKALSGGMRRRFGIAQALLHRPQILIVDEPTAGLDPQERIRFRNLLCEFSKNRLVILSTHIVEDMEATCQNIAVLEKGTLLFADTTSKLIQQAAGNVYSVTIPQEELQKLESNYTVLSMQAEESQIHCRILSDTVPNVPHSVCCPTLEAGYLQLLKKHEKKEVVK